jgi:hypothetical protein
MTPPCDRGTPGLNESPCLTVSTVPRPPEVTDSRRDHIFE